MTRLRQTLPEDALDATDRAILNALQDGFPLTPQPFEDAGAALVLGDLFLEDGLALAQFLLGFFLSIPGQGQHAV